MPPARPFHCAHRIFAISVATLMMAVTSGCGLFTNENPKNTQPVGAGLELTRVTVGALAVVNGAAIHMAIKKGHFKDEGLQIELKTLPGGGADAIPGLKNGELHFSFGNYVSFFTAKAKGVLDIKLIADGYQAGTGVYKIVAPRDSKINNPQQLAGKKIAINTKGNIVELTARSSLEAVGVDLKTVTFVEIPFPDMQAGLARKNVDAAFMAEPYITEAERTDGVLHVLDPVRGPTSEIPIAGWAANAEFVARNPKTTAAFQRAIIKGQQACAYRPDVEELVTEYAKVDKQTASLMKIGTWPTTLEPTRLQRVADLMKTYGVLTQPFDVKSLIFKASQ